MQMFIPCKKINIFKDKNFFFCAQIQRMLLLPGNMRSFLAMAFRSKFLAIMPRTAFLNT